MKNNLSIGVGLFAYNRPSHLKRVLISLENFKIDNLTVFIDGPKNKQDEIIQKNILFMLKTSKIKNFKIIKRKKNLGLSNSLLSGINHLSKKFDSFIILEDDCVPYSNFFKYFNYCLKKYQNNTDVNSICSYQFKGFNNNEKNILKLLKLEHFIPWGWGTWSFKWRQYIETKDRKYSNFPNFMNKFNKSNYRKIKYRDIWSLDYILYQYTNSKFSIFPNVSLVKNIGFDGTGVNSKFSSMFISKENIIKKTNFKDDSYSIRYSNKQKKILKEKIDLFF